MTDAELDELLGGVGRAAILREVGLRCGSEVVGVVTRDTARVSLRSGLTIRRAALHIAALEDGREAPFTPKEDERWRGR